MSTQPHDNAFDSDEGEPEIGEQPHGATYQEYGEEDDSAAPSPYGPYPSPRRWFLRIAIFLMFASAVGVGIWFWVVRGRVQEDLQKMDEQGLEFIEKFFEDLRSERLGQAYQSTSTAFKQRMNQKQFEDFVAKHKETLAEPPEGHKFRVPPTTMTAFGKKVTGEYIGTRKAVAGAKEQVLIKIVREEGALKVEEMSVTRT